MVVLAALALVAAIAAAVVRDRRAPEAAVALGGALLLLVLGGLSWGAAKDEAADLAPTLVVLASLLVLGEGCEKAGLFDALAARLAGGRARLRAAAADAGRGGGRRGDRGARPRRDRRAAHARGVRRRGQGTPGGPPARLRVRAPGELGVAAAADQQPDQPVGVPRHRAVVRPLRGADGAAVGGRDRDRVGRAALGLPPRPRGPRPHAARTDPAARRRPAGRARGDARGLRGGGPAGARRRVAGRRGRAADDGRDGGRGGRGRGGPRQRRRAAGRRGESAAAGARRRPRRRVARAPRRAAATAPRRRAVPPPCATWRAPSIFRCSGSCSGWG